ncbi:MAG TPA: glycosyltransferase N-terminal domain-containing protein [Gemmatimonadaceae bacterium]
MNPALALAYEGAARLAHALSSVAPHSDRKLLATFVERRGILARYAGFRRDTARPLLWMHAPSVGEGLQARPVLQLARSRRPDLQLAYTWFSPSARAFASTLDVDFRDALPFDATPDMRAALAALAPSALVFSKLDVWPTLAREASRRGTRLGLISATLARSSSRRSPLASSLLREAYARLERVGAISSEDADRLISLGVPAMRVSVTGDTRYDQVWARAQNVDRHGALLEPLAAPERLTLVAGSTWPADEAQLLPAWARLARQHGVRRPRLIIAPHEPTVAHLAPIERWASSEGLVTARLAAPAAGHADVIIVDRVGILGDLYALADVAFVGGGFHAAGLHSVLEPAAFGAPVLFGPRHHASRDAMLLLDADGALDVASDGGLERGLDHWFTDSAARRAAGDAARAVVHRGLGAAERSWELVESLLR